MHQPISENRTYDCAYHVISDQLEMSYIDIYLVRAEHSPNLAQDGCPCHLHAISHQDRINIVGVNGVVVDDTVPGSTCKLPDATEIGPIRSKLHS